MDVVLKVFKGIGKVLWFVIRVITWPLRFIWSRLTARPFECGMPDCSNSLMTQPGLLDYAEARIDGKKVNVCKSCAAQLS